MPGFWGFKIVASGIKAATTQEPDSDSHINDHYRATVTQWFEFEEAIARSLEFLSSSHSRTESP